jgi:hypothetical protein
MANVSSVAAQRTIAVMVSASMHMIFFTLADSSPRMPTRFRFLHDWPNFHPR